MRMLNSLLLVAVMAFSFSSSAHACSCIFTGRFAEFSMDSPLVLRATVVSYGKELSGFPDDYPDHYEDMVVQVTDVLKGSYQGKELTLYGDTGMSCLKYVSEDNYPLDSEHLFALVNADTRQPLRSCGESSVLIDGAWVEGRDPTSTPKRYSISLDELLDTIGE